VSPIVCSSHCCGRTRAFVEGCCNLKCRMTAPRSRHSGPHQHVLRCDVIRTTAVVQPKELVARFRRVRVADVSHTNQQHSRPLGSIRCVRSTSCFAVVCGISAAQAVTLYVSVNGDDAGNNCSVAAEPCRSLPVALNASRNIALAAVVTVELSAGDYGAWNCGGLSERDVTLAGVGGGVNIDCGGVDRLLRVVNSSVHVQDIVVRNGLAVVSRVVCNDDDEPEGGGAVSIEWGDDTPRAAVFTNVTFVQCSAVTSTSCGAYGGALSARFGSNALIVLRRCGFFDTYADSGDELGSYGGNSAGGAVNLRTRLSAPLTTNLTVSIEGCSFERTETSNGFLYSNGGAVSFSGGRNVSGVQFTVADSTFADAIADLQWCTAPDEGMCIPSLLVW
jgi:hypothetical protein